MVEREMIRVAIPYGFMTYFLDGANQKGITYELVEQFGVYLKEQRDISGVTIVVIPARRDEVLAMVADGRRCAGTLTITDGEEFVVSLSRSGPCAVFVPGRASAARPRGAGRSDIHIRRSAASSSI
jgi:hypothetical protein